MEKIVIVIVLLVLVLPIYDIASEVGLGIFAFLFPAIFVIAAIYVSSLIIRGFKQ